MMTDARRSGSPVDGAGELSGDVLDGDRIVSALGNAVQGVPFRVHVFDSLTSTNDLAKEWAKEGAEAGTVVLAETQSMGKGRQGRGFYSPPGSGLYLSMILRSKRPLDQLMLLTTAVAVAGAKAIEGVWQGKIGIKWVNDLYVEDKKISGILVETGAEYMVVGIGINVRRSDTGFPVELAEKAGVLCQGDEVIERNQLAAEVIRQVWMHMQELEEEPERAAKQIIQEARSRSCVLGKAVLIEGHSEISDGIAMDLDEQGSLIVRDAQGKEHRLYTGEISLRVKTEKQYG